MQIHVIQCGFLKVRAEEMIRPLSAKSIRLTYKVDDLGYMSLTMNALLVIEGNHVVLIDPGCADFLPSRLVREYGLEIPEPLEEVLGKVGIHTDQVTDVVFTHLHFDHGSGAFKRIPGEIVKRFPNAMYHMLQEHYEYITGPDLTDTNSFFNGLFKYVDEIHWLENWNCNWMEFRIYNGHTKGMVIPVIKTEEAVTCFVSDLIPMDIFMRPEVYSSYDTNPDQARKDKKDFLDRMGTKSRLIYFHDPLIDSKIYP